MVEIKQEVDKGTKGKMGSERFLLKSAEDLRRGIDYAVKQLSSRKISDETKIRWIRSLTRQIEALVKVVEALNNAGGKSASDIDLAAYLSSIEKRVEVPVKEARTMRRAALEFHDVVRQASTRVGGLYFEGKRRTCRSRG